MRTKEDFIFIYSMRKNVRDRDKEKNNAFIHIIPYPMTARSMKPNNKLILCLDS